MRLTEAGQKLLDGATRVLRDIERTGDEIRAQDAHPSGKIILGVTPTLCPVLAPELFARMRRDYPMIELKIMHAGMVRLEEFVIDGRVDIAQDAGRAVEKFLPGLGEADAAIGAGEQRDVEFLFEALHMAGQRRLRDMQMRRGARDAAELGDADEIMQAAQLHRGTDFESPWWASYIFVMPNRYGADQTTVFV